MDKKNLEQLATTVRMLSADMVEKANSGHPGLPLGAADYAALIWANYLRFNPRDTQWPGRDRFVLSAGHGSALLYSLLNLFGFDLPMSELQRFRQWESKTPGHPEFGVTAGVETTTGPLGQGFANGVGMAMAAKLSATRYGSDLFDSRIFALVSDGDLMEGVAAEAASFAAHLKLGNLIYVYDDNKITLAGTTEVCFTENVAERFRAYGWHVQEANGHDLDAMSRCLDAAIAEKGKPSIICARTTIGKGSPGKANTYEVHGAPLGAAELKATKENLGWPLEPTFFVPQEVSSACAAAVEDKSKQWSAWQDSFNSWKKQNADKAAQYEAQRTRSLPAALKQELISTFGTQAKADATRNLSGAVIQVLAKHLPGFVGGSADLEHSTKTLIKGEAEFQATSLGGRNLRFGVREHAMGAIANGMAYSREWFPFTATFLVFSDYMRPTIRLAALSHLQTLFVFTHDSFWVGEDGPTHEPIEHVAALRLIPNLLVHRPADGLEVAMSYYTALEAKKRPSTLLFTRQNLGVLTRPANFKPEDIQRGAYVLHDVDKPELVIVATGSEVAAAVEAAKTLKVKTRVVSMPCQELYFEQDAQYKQSLFPANTKVVSVEAGLTRGWERITGSSGLNIGIDHYGASAPGELLADKFGFTAPKIAARIESWLATK